MRPRVWIFDKKRENADLGSKLGMLIIQLSTLAENPMLIEAFAYLLRATMYLLSATHEIIQCRHHVTKKYPYATIHDLLAHKEKLLQGKKIPSRKIQIFDSVRDRLKTLIHFCGQAYEHPIGVPIEVLANHDIVFVDDIPDRAASSFRLYCLLERLKIHLQTTLHSVPPGTLRNVVIIDEANLYEGIGQGSVSRDFDTAYFSEHFLQIVREFGCAIIIAASNMVRTEIHENTSVKMFGAPSSGEHLFHNAKMATFANDQPKIETYSNLDLGQFIVKTPDTNGVFCIQASKPMEKKPLPPHEFTQHAEESMMYLSQYIPVIPDTSKKTRELKSVLPADQHLYLKTLYENPDEKHGVIIKLSGRSVNRIGEARDALEKARAIALHTLKGSGAYYYEILPDALDAYFKGKSPYNVHGGFIHWLVTIKTAKKLEILGFKKIRIENGADITCEYEKKPYAFEIEVTATNVEENYRRNFSKGMFTYFVVQTQKEKALVESKALGFKDAKVVIFKDILETNQIAGKQLELFR